jgi:hypothetical protein
LMVRKAEMVLTHLLKAIHIIDWLLKIKIYTAGS